ncbi:MAG TPA: HAD family phosphatase [Bryobacteraceae bacterium]|nr:HAD family phosphatase [Bryobacteraceae bacterium]
MAYKALIFDLGKTLVHFDFQRGYRALEGLCPHPAAEIPRRLAGTGLVERFETGLVEPHDFVTQMASVLELRVDYQRFCQIWGSIFADTLVPDSMLAALHARYRMVLLSNTNAIHFEFIRARYATLLRHFDACVLSYEVKSMKPHAGIYHAAIEKAGCPAAECFYTDDIADYVAGARALGIDAVQFQNAAQLERDLLARGIRWEG